MRNSLSVDKIKFAVAKVAVFALLFFTSVVSFANAEQVEAFSSHVIVNKNGSLTIQEEIAYNFGAAEHHGIIRTIPLIYKLPGGKHELPLDISSISVTDGRGNLRPTSYDKGGNSVSLKIGDPDILVSGQQFYVIHYTIWGAITPGLTKDIVYWDATGDAWGIPIDRARVDVVLPLSLPLDQVSRSCYIGTDTDPCEATSTRGTATNTANLLRFEQDNLGKQVPFRVNVGIPKGIVFFTQAPGQEKKRYVAGYGIVKWWQKPYIDASLSLPFFVFAGMFSLWWSQNEPKGRKGKSAKKYTLPDPFAPRFTYLIAGLVGIGISFYTPAWNLGIFGSGIVIFCFSFLYRK